ncbi:MFS transporter [Hyphomicrobium methylovorum]|uniref:MFS transporter n=1 Tax=Hyphomicrobium methylovorum TaxID=84 RepID=UPI0015E7E308|nr:MFS transporter [Hyphomicrobium methylovorum]MBA2127406.1 MFS transporter [Hyphomicrobium methylovorum]
MQKREQRECPRTLKSARRSGQGIDWFAFFVADVQMGFGPFLSVYLTTEKWTNADIGLVFTIVSVIALLGQLPGGALVDAVRREKLLASIAMVAIGISAFCIALWPRFSAVILAQTLHAAASVIIGPALAALSLRLVGHRLIGERLGRNAAFGSAGSVVAAIAMGVCGYLLTSQAVFFVSASMVIPALIALQFVSSEDLKHHKVAQIEDTTYDFRNALKELSGHRPLLILAISVALFHLSNAAVLPLVANIITLRSSEAATALVALCIIGPQIIVTLASAPVGRYADRYGRHKLLLIGFASLPIRIVLLAATTEPAILVTIQILDGISATALGVLVASSVADITEESGNFNLALGFIGIAMGLGAAISTALGGYLAYRLGVEAAFLALASIGLVAFTTVACALPETKIKDTREQAA